MSDYNITNAIGVQRPITELTDEEISKLMWRVLPRIQKAVYHFLKVRQEWMRRGLTNPGRFLQHDEMTSIEFACQQAIDTFGAEGEGDPE